MKSKSKTFELQAEIGDLMDFVINNIETEDREIPYSGAEPTMDVRVETKRKYKITITTYEPKPAM